LGSAVVFVERYGRTGTRKSIFQAHGNHVEKMASGLVIQKKAARTKCQTLLLGPKGSKRQAFRWQTRRRKAVGKMTAPPEKTRRGTEWSGLEWRLCSTCGSKEAGLGSVAVAHVDSAKAAETGTELGWIGESMQRRLDMFLFGSGSARLDRVACHGQG
jgi:hypothetical protein